MRTVNNNVQMEQLIALWYKIAKIR